MSVGFFTFRNVVSKSRNWSTIGSSCGNGRAVAPISVQVINHPSSHASVFIKYIYEDDVDKDAPHIMRDDSLRSGKDSCPVIRSALEFQQ